MYATCQSDPFAFNASLRTPTIGLSSLLSSPCSSIKLLHIASANKLELPYFKQKKRLTLSEQTCIGVIVRLACTSQTLLTVQGSAWLGADTVPIV